MELDILKSYLVHLEFPEIGVLSDEEVADLFRPGERVKFLRWAMERMGYDDFPKVRHGLVPALAEMVHCNGFCTGKQKRPFVAGAEELPVKDQLMIIVRILEFLKTLKDAEAAGTGFDEEGRKDLTAEDLLAFEGEPLLDCCQSAKANRRAKIENFEGRMARARAEIAALKGQLDEGASKKIEDLTKVKKDARAEINEDFAGVIAQFSRTVDKLKVDERVQDDVELRGKLEVCGRLSGVLNQLSKNMELIGEFKRMPFPVPERGSSRISGDVEKAVEMSAEALECMKLSEEYFYILLENRILRTENTQKGRNLRAHTTQRVATFT